MSKLFENVSLAIVVCAHTCVWSRSLDYPCVAFAQGGPVHVQIQGEITGFFLNDQVVFVLVSHILLLGFKWRVSHIQLVSTHQQVKFLSKLLMRLDANRFLPLKVQKWAKNGTKMGQKWVENALQLKLWARNWFLHNLLIFWGTFALSDFFLVASLTPLRSYLCI